MADLRLGDWREVLADVGQVDALICDPPYGERTHAWHDAGATGHKGTGRDSSQRRTLTYAAWTETDVALFVSDWTPRVSGWIACMTSHDLAPHWDRALRECGRYVFAPIPCVIPGMTVRLGGDGPSSWAVWLIAARPSTREFSTWGTLPGAYIGRRSLGHIGGKPLDLMRAIVRDYSRPGDLVCDPCAGSGTTLVAAVTEGRRAVGAEIDPETHRKAVARIERGYTPALFAGVAE